MLRKQSKRDTWLHIRNTRRQICSVKIYFKSIYFFTNLIDEMNNLKKKRPECNDKKSSKYFSYKPQYALTIKEKKIFVMSSKLRWWYQKKIHFDGVLISVGMLRIAMFSQRTNLLIIMWCSNLSMIIFLVLPSLIRVRLGMSFSISFIYIWLYI